MKVLNKTYLNKVEFLFSFLKILIKFYSTFF